MKNNYIKIIASSNNEFRTTMDIAINGQEYKNVNVKIDTGCPQTTILTSKLGISGKSSRKMKTADIHIGTIDTGETVMLACPKNAINREYLDELEKLIEESADVNISLITEK